MVEIEELMKYEAAGDPMTGTKWMRTTPQKIAEILNSRATSPPPRHYGHVAYDTARERIVLFGGYTAGPYIKYLSDTWTRDGKDWSRHWPKTFPPSPGFHNLAYDPVRREVVLFGGAIRRCYPGGGCTWTAITETWTWNGLAWTKRSPPVSPARTSHFMVYEPNLGGIVLFGGSKTTGGVWTVSWLWNGKTWSRLSTKGQPGLGYGLGSAFDAARQRIVGIGGTNRSLMTSSNKTWILDTGRFRGSLGSYGQGCGTRSCLLLSAGTSLPPRLGKAYALRSSNLPLSSTLALLAIGQSRTAWGSLPVPADLRSLGMPGCSLYASLDVLLPFQTKKGVGTLSLALPNQSSLLGRRLFLQTIGIASKVNTAGLLTSNGAQLSLGNQ